MGLTILMGLFGWILSMVGICCTRIAEAVQFNTADDYLVIFGLIAIAGFSIGTSKLKGK